MNVELRDEAREDLVNGAAFYGVQAWGLDDYFLRSMRDDLKKLEYTGGIHELYEGFHRSLSERFPFAIYYLIHDEKVDVVAVLDCRSDSSALTARLDRAKR